jgi:hypothetical protein
MTTWPDNPYRNITPEELHLVMRRAHIERAKAVRQFFATLLDWRRKAAERQHATEPALKTVGCH